MKKLSFLIIFFAFLQLHCMEYNERRDRQNQKLSAQSASGKNVTMSDDIHKEINKLINDNERLKKEVERLSNSNLNREKDDKIAELEKQVEYLGTSLINTLKTFEANINAKDFSKVLKENLSKLDSKESAKLVNEAMANALYRLKFMYTEARYLLNWTNGKINWKAAAEKGIKVPVFKDSVSEDQIKNMVMAVTVD